MTEWHFLALFINLLVNIHHINIRYYHEHTLSTEYICYFSVKLMSCNESNLWDWASTNAFKNVPNGHRLTKNKYIYWEYILCLWHFLIQKHMNCCYEHEFLVQYLHTCLERQIFSWKSVEKMHNFVVLSALWKTVKWEIITESMLYDRNNVETVEVVRYVPKMDSSRSQKKVAYSMTCCGQGVVRQVTIKKLQNISKSNCWIITGNK